MSEPVPPIPQRYVADTHSLIWRLTNSPRLGPNAAAVFDAVDAGEARLIIPAVVLAELILTVERGRVVVDLAFVLEQIQRHPHIELSSLSPAIVLRLPGARSVPEMHDRLIVCEANLHDVPLLTADRSITVSGLTTVVW
jgi:PIN domain nuclease of toxin-antitoxin system